MMNQEKTGNKYASNTDCFPGASDSQLVGNGHDHFEDGHEGGNLAEVAAADHLGVDLQAPLVVLAGHAAADLVEAVQYVLGELVRERKIKRFFFNGWTLCLNCPVAVMCRRLYIPESMSDVGRSISASSVNQDGSYLALFDLILPLIF